MSSLQKKVLTGKLPRGLPPRPMPVRGSSRGGGRGGGRGGARVYTPLHWNRYFSSSKQYTIGTSFFNVYLGKSSKVI